MPTNLIPGADVFTFAGLELYGVLQNLADTRRPRLAIHEFPKRDGARIEYMGRAPHRVQMELHFVGGDFRAQYKRLLDLVDTYPTGQLIHPLLGQFLASCEGVDRAYLDVPAGVNYLRVPVSFVEAALDLAVEAQPTVSGAQQKVSDLTTSLATESATFSYAATAISACSSTATAYVTAAAALAQDSTVDPSLDARLDAVGAATQAAITATLADPAATTNARAYPVLALLERTYAACLEMSEAVRASQPATYLYVVPSTCSIGALVQSLYGHDGLAHLDAILSLNRIADPSRIAAGTILVVPKE